MPDVLCFDQYGNSLSHLTQWDNNIVITIKDYEYETTPIFHFSNRYSKQAIVEIGELKDGEASAKVPNILLTNSETITAYVFTTKENVQYKSETFTTGQCVYKIEIPIHARIEPDDYEYVENIEKLELSVVEAHIAEMIEEAENIISGAAITAQTSIASTASTAQSNIETAVSEAESSIEDMVDTAESNVEEMISDANDLIVTKIDDLETDYNNKVALLTQLLNNGLIDIRNSLSGGSPKAVVTPSNLDEYLSGNTHEAGIYLFSGFAVGSDYYSYNDWIAWYDPTATPKFSEPLLLYNSQGISDNSISYSMLNADLKMAAVEDNRIFTNQANADAYLLTTHAKAGQLVKIYDGEKFKVYIVQDNGNNGFEFAGVTSGCVIVATKEELPTVGDQDTDYYVGSGSSYVHYRYLTDIDEQHNDGYVPVGGDSYAKSDTYTKEEVANLISNTTYSKSETYTQDEIEDLVEGEYMKLADISIDNINVPLNSNGEPDTSSEEFEALAVGQIFACIVDEDLVYWVKKSDEDCKCLSESGLVFNSGYVDDDGYLHLTLNDIDVEGFDTFYVGTGGGGGSTAGISLTNVVKPSSIRNGANAIFSFTATETGDQNITVKWYVDNLLIETQSDRPSGSSFSFNAKNYLKASDTSTVKAQITSAGGGSLTRQWEVTSTAFALTWGATISPIMLFTSNESVYAVISVSAQPIAENIVTLTLGNYSTSKTVVGSKTVTFELTPDKFEVGVNEISATMAVSSDPTDTTDPISFKAIWGYGATEPIVALAESELSGSQYDTINIDYLVYDPDNESVVCTMEIGDDAPRNLRAMRTMQTLPYSSQDYGIKSVTLSYGGATDTMTLTIAKSDYNIGMVTGDNLRYILDPVGHSNDDADRESFGNMTFSSGFDWTNGGFLTDADGMAFVVKKGHRATLPRQIFGDTDNNGKTIDISFKIKNSDIYDSVAMQELDNGESKGLILRANEGELRLNNTTGQLFRYFEESRIDLSINIEELNDQRVMTVWLDGIPSLANTYQASTLVQTENSLIIGSDHCDVWVYALHVYNTSLSFKDMIQNYIALAPTTLQKVERCQENDVYYGDTISKSSLHTARPDLTIITIAADRLPTGKSNSDYVNAEVTIQDGADILELGEGTKYKMQGTSSLAYARSACNLDINFKDTGKKYKLSENAIPVNYLNIKTNVASSENANNICAADNYNTYQPYLVPARANDGVRDTVEGKPCAVFFTNTSSNTIWASSQQVLPGQTILYAMGDLCNSKKNLEVFGQDGKGENYAKGCIEVSGNDTAAQQFRATSTYNPTTDQWETTVGSTTSTDFEWRAEPLDDDYTEVINAWNTAVAWVVSTNMAAATNNTLSPSKTYDGVTYTKDSAEYRLAKFKAEVENYFALDSLLYHFLYLEFYAALDNVSKNSFYSYEWDSKANKYLWNICKNYDDDTILGCDNDGVPLVDYGTDYGDTAGSRALFNADNNTIWVNIQQGFSKELADMYINLKGKNAWDANTIITKWDNYQAKRPHAAMAADAYNKYILPYKTTGVIVGTEEKSYDGSYLPRLQGSKTYQRRQFITYQSRYMDGKYGYYSTSSSIKFRANAPAGTTEDLDITAYAKTYVTLIVDNGTRVRNKINKGDTVTFENTAVHSNATIYITPEKLVQSVVPIDKINNSTFEAAGASKLQDVTLGSADSENTAWDANTGLSVPSPILKTLSVRNITNFSQALDLSLNVELESVDTRGTQAGRITLPSYAPLETINLNACSGIKALNLNEVETFTMASGNNLTSVYIENCNTVLNDAMKIYLADAISASGTATRRIRMTGIDWVVTDTTMLKALAKWKGYNELGAEIDNSVLGGTVHINTIRRRDYDYLVGDSGVWKNTLTIDYENIIEEHSITFLNEDKTPILSLDDGTAYTEWVSADSVTYNPITEGEVATPTKASSTKYDYTFSHWAIFANNTVGAEFTFGRTLAANITLIAVYTSSLRKFTVNWYDGTNTTTRTLLHSDNNVEYGTSATYDMPIANRLIYDDSNTTSGGHKQIVSKVFKQWDKSTGNITSNLDVCAIYETANFTTYTITVDQENDVTKEVFDVVDTLGVKKELKDMTYPEILAIIKNNQVDYNNATYTDTLGETQSYNFFEQRDDYDFRMGTDYSFDNVVEDTIVEIDNEVYLDGTNAFIPTIYEVTVDGQKQRKVDLTGVRGEQIKLFDEDKSFTLAFDFQATDNSGGYAPASGDILLSCMGNVDDGDDGFRLLTQGTSGNIHQRILWGGNYQKVAQSKMEDIVVLRHIAGDNNLYVYSFNASTSTDNVYGLTQTSVTMSRSSDITITDAPLVIGGTANKNGDTYEISSSNQGAGIIHWFKIWYDDLGDDIAKQLSSWTREKARIEYYSTQVANNGLSYDDYGSPFLLSGTNTRGNASFVFNSTLRYSHVMNRDNYNSGGWGGYNTSATYQSMYNFCQQRVLKGLPQQLQPFIKQVKVPSTAGNKSTTINQYDSYIYIPSYNEMFGNGNEGRLIPWYPANANASAKRLDFRGILIPKTAVTASGTAIYTTAYNDANEPVFGSNSNKGLYDPDTNPNGVKEGDIWQANNATGYIFISADTMKRTGRTPGKIVSKNGVVYGGWVGASFVWLRSPYTRNANTFYGVNNTGAYNNTGNAYTAYGVRPCFTI